MAQSEREKRRLLLEVSQQITKAKLKKMIFLCHDIPQGVLEKAVEVIDLFGIIGQRDDTNQMGIKYIADLLNDMGEFSLRDKLLGIEESDFHKECGIEGKILLKTTELMAADWKMFARQLGLEEHIIKNILADVGNNCETCCIEMLKIWQNKNGNSATVGKLKEALTNMYRKDVFEEIEKIEAKIRGEKYPIQVTDSKEECISDEFQRTVFVEKPTRPTGSKSKFNITIEPGNSVMVGDGGKMTVIMGQNLNAADSPRLEQALAVAAAVREKHKGPS